MKSTAAARIKQPELTWKCIYVCYYLINDRSEGCLSPTQPHFLSAAVGMSWKPFLFCFFVFFSSLLCCHSAHDNVVFPHTRTDMQTFHESQNTTCQTMWDLFWCLTFWVSLTKSHIIPSHFTFLYGRNTDFILGALFICGSHILCHTQSLFMSKIILLCVCHSLYLT